jgi:CRISPR system Cascade subunit CasB
MNGFIGWLESLNEKDTKVRAVLRRSLAFDPGAYVPAYPYVEPFLNDEDNPWKRKIFYLVAGLWASHWREGQIGAAMPIGEACAIFESEKRKHLNKNDRQKSSSTEKRFITLLDSDRDQLSHRLRQMVALLNDQAIDFESMINGLLYWNDDQKRTQHSWARDFYRNINFEMDSETTTKEEKKNEDHD